MGKGSAPRPMEIDREQFGNRFDAIFGKPKEAVKKQAQDNNAQPTRDPVDTLGEE